MSAKRASSSACISSRISNTANWSSCRVTAGKSIVMMVCHHVLSCSCRRRRTESLFFRSVRLDGNGSLLTISSGASAISRFRSRSNSPYRRHARTMCARPVAGSGAVTLIAYSVLACRPASRRERVTPSHARASYVGILLQTPQCCLRLGSLAVEFSCVNARSIVCTWQSWPSGFGLGRFADLAGVRMSKGSTVLATYLSLGS